MDDFLIFGPEKPDLWRAFACVRADDKVACMASFEPEGYFRDGKLVSCIEFQFDGGPKDGKTIMTGLVFPSKSLSGATAGLIFS